MTILRSPIRGQILRSPLRSPIEVTAGVAPPTPVFSGLIAEYDAALPNAFDATGDGDKIGIWFDGFTNNFDATANGTPKLDLNAQNGLPGVQMERTSFDFFDIGDLSAFENDDFTIFFVGRRNGTGTADGISTVQGQLSGGGGIAGIFFCTDPDTLRGIYSDGVSLVGPQSVATISTSPKVLTFRKIGGNIELFDGLTSIATASAAATIDFTTSTTKRTILGADYFDSGGGPNTLRHWDGLFFEWRMYDNGFDSISTTGFINHLGNKWGIPV